MRKLQKYWRKIAFRSTVQDLAEKFLRSMRLFNLLNAG